MKKMQIAAMAIGALPLSIGSLSYGDVPGNVRVVDADASGAGDGSSWDDAYTNLNNALAEADFDQSITEIWIAAGTYTPSDNDRTVSFDIPEGVVVYGGFAGGEQDAKLRDPQRRTTILSGDLNGDDCPNFGNRNDNSFNVVTSINPQTDPPVIQDLIIQGGYANGSANFAVGGGIYLARSDARIVNCIIRDNFANDSGAGVYSSGELPIGPAATPELHNCTIYNNATDALGNGGGVGLTNADLFAVNCLIYENQSANGAGIYVGPGGLVPPSTAELINCTIVDNSATSSGSGIDRGDLVEVDLSNCILWGNDVNGVTNEAAQLSGADHPDVDINHTDIEGLDQWADNGTGNLNVDPQFSNPEEGNYRTPAGTPVINQGDATVVPPDTFDIDRDTDISEKSPDLDEGNRVDDSVVDLGAYEQETDCNDNGTPDDQDIAAGTADDCNENGIPDECDIFLGLSSDDNADGVPDDCQQCDVEILVLIDTSGSVVPEHASICNDLIPPLQGLMDQTIGLVVEVRIFALDEPGLDCDCADALISYFDPLDGTIDGQVNIPGDQGDCVDTLPVAGGNEAWGSATSVAAGLYTWKADTRIIIPIGDELPCSGFAGGGPGDIACPGDIGPDEIDAIDNAIAQANAKGVYVMPVMPSESPDCVIDLADTLANATGGEMFAFEDYGSFASLATDLVEFGINPLLDPITPCVTCYGDLTGDCLINTADLLELLGNWGTDGPGAELKAPLDLVNTADLLALLGVWGECSCAPASAYVEPVPQSVSDCLERYPMGSEEQIRCIEAMYLAGTP